MTEEYSDIQKMEDLISNSLGQSATDNLELSSKEVTDYSAHTDILKYIQDLAEGNFVDDTTGDIQDNVYSRLSDYQISHPDNFIKLLDELEVALKNKSATNTHDILEVINDFKHNFK